jgi:hypothetical protein
MMFIMFVCLPFYAFHIFGKPSGMISGGTNAVMTCFLLGGIYLQYIDSQLVSEDSPILKEKVSKLGVINTCADENSDVDLPLYQSELNKTAIDMSGYIFIQIYIVLISCAFMCFKSVLSPEKFEMASSVRPVLDSEFATTEFNENYHSND